MKSEDWREAAKELLRYENLSRSLHRPPATGCVLSWRNQRRIGSIQAPILPEFPAVTLLSINSKHIEPEFIKALCNEDPGRLRVTADDILDLREGNFHILRLEGTRLTCMTYTETLAMENASLMIQEIRPTSEGLAVVPVLHRGAPIGGNN